MSDDDGKEKWHPFKWEPYPLFGRKAEIIIRDTKLTVIHWERENKYSVRLAGGGAKLVEHEDLLDALTWLYEYERGNIR